MNKKYCLIILSLILINFALAQNTISGKVYDKVTKEALCGAAVIIPNTQMGCTTNINGHFTLSTEQSADSIEVRCLGYQTERFKTEQEQILKISLSPSTTNIQEVVITA